MSDTVNVYTADGATTDFTIAFSYLDDSFVVVKVEDEGFADVTGSHPGSLVDASTYRFDANVPNNFRVTFTRDTNLSTDLFTWAAGAIFRPSDIGDSMKLLRDYTEEKNDQTSNTVINAQTDAVTSATNTSITKANEASASATAASGSASAAAASQSAAATSETNASTSETNAAASQAASAASQTAAASSESNASTSETNAAASQVAAASSESNASTSETNAAASAASAVSARDIVREVILGQFADDAAVDTYLSGVSYTKDAGDLYFNTTDGRMKVYTGSAWSDIANTTSSASATASATAALAAQTAAEAALNTFVNQYLGSYASDAAVNAAKASVLSAGDIYFDTTTTQLKYYNGSAWNPAAAAQVLNTSSLGNVGDVDYTNTPQPTDYLRRNSSNHWERRAVADVKADLGLANAAADISTNATNIATNAAGIATNVTNIATNATAIATNATAIATNTTAISTNDTDIATNATNIGTLQSQMSTAQSDITTNATAIAGKQAVIATSTALAAASLTTQETGDSGSVSVDVRKANPRTTTGTHTLLGGATLYYANGSATYDVSALTPGDIVTIYCETGTVTVGQGSGSVVLFKDGEATGVASNATVTIGADALATVTCVSATKAIIAGSDLT